jgi:Domain of unknown function (DUF1707)
MFDRIEWLKARGRTLERGEFRASDADREDAFRRIKVHETMGHLDEREAWALQMAVKASPTVNDIAKAFVDAGLPELPARSPSTERRVSTQEKDEAISLLEKAYAEGRIETGECAAAKDRVSVARTRSEIDAAFHGLASPTRVAVANTTSNVTKQATHVFAESGRRVGTAFRRGMLAAGAMMIGVILLIAGIGAAALICLVGAVLVGVSAAISLVTSQS